MEVFGEEIFDIFKGHDFASIGRVDLVNHFKILSGSAILKCFSILTF